MASTAIIVPSGAGEVLQVLTDRIRVLASVPRAGAGYEIFELTGPEGSGPPPHSHPWDEGYLVLDGEIDVRAADAQSRVQTGGFVFVPAGSVHAFRIMSPSARFVVFTSGTGAGEFFRAMDREIGFPPSSFEEVHRVAIRHGLTVAA